MHSVIMVMGVSGCGKSTVGQALSDALGGVFVEGDDYHPQSNIDHMAAGLPLTDAMRWPWLDRLAEAVNDQRQRSVTVFGCSALRKSYRDRLRAAIPDLKVAYLEAPQDVLATRLAKREGHYMPASLLASQYDTLEVPENATVATSANQPIAQIIQIFKSAI